MTNKKEARLVQVLDEYMAERRAGRAPKPAELIRRHPDLAKDIEECLSCLDLVEAGFAEKRDGGGAPADRIPCFRSTTLCHVPGGWPA